MKFKLSTAKKIMEYIDANEGKQISIADLAEYAAVPHSNARYLVELLIKQGKIRRVQLKGFNARYIRYTYYRESCAAVK